MNKDQYTVIEQSTNSAIAELSKSYSRQEKRWLLNSEEEILKAQEDLRALKHYKQMAFENYLVTGYINLPNQLKDMLEPIVTRRLWRDLKDPRNDAPAVLQSQVQKADGTRFTFPGTELNAPKHLKGFWSCTACMPDIEKVKLLTEEFQLMYGRRVQWCPKFVRTLAQNKTPEHYYNALLKINRDGDIPVCFAGLMHIEFQTSETEAKIVQYCDTCGFTATETKQLQKPINPEEFEVNMEDTRTISCKCTICEDIIFEAVAKEAMTSEGLTEKYEKILEQHYKDKHP